MTTDPYDVHPPALGAIVEAERGSLPFALIHGEGLVACAAWALGDAGITPVDHGVSWADLVESGDTFVLHDALCPMTPASFLADCVRTSEERSAVVVAVRPVTDTVKQVEDGYVGATIDRDALVVVTSPIVLPAEVVASLDGLPTHDFAELAGLLAARFPVVTVEAPPEGRRVASLDDVRLLEALTLPR
ncbi:2-C-methyl-D-erythritol 4-phosphate cytidylyltransferase [Nocardioides sp. CER19]|uniref:2-C-methyl-D-erythritol 4-phosphate cytidylyltransferase n=1 Tax=Nocardioides sp. CER19 TaxID=3038538 RepID=UPI00244ADB5C|nr:2-C-methyl-D-erythritol 4-phosphate cytidylyltransferase [Nocardioides sp. CER19]MDH2413404.1 2-C-methyl-D-erythritol 4-phosphate cytidylyltransferase [Nocardioides sp. CER19]